MAVHSFLPYALEVPDQAVGQRFYENFGLVDGTTSSDAVRLRPERLARDTVLLYGGPRKLGHVLLFTRGWQPGWGLGRHVIGSNFFFYLRDPWGSFSEYYFDLDYIPEGCAWQPRDFPPEDSLYVWGPPCPADFGENKEAWT
ncbi:MAG TPA: hypothetical protein VGB86_13970 [Methylomirabilota bacterium]